MHNSRGEWGLRKLRSKFLSSAELWNNHFLLRENAQHHREQKTTEKLLLCSMSPALPCCREVCVTLISISFWISQLLQNWSLMRIFAFIWSSLPYLVTGGSTDGNPAAQQLECYQCYVFPSNFWRSHSTFTSMLCLAVDAVCYLWKVLQHRFRLKRLQWNCKLSLMLKMPKSTPDKIATYILSKHLCF